LLEAHEIAEVLDRHVCFDRRRGLKLPPLATVPAPSLFLVSQGQEEQAGYHGSGDEIGAG
jgi:hypothetical protein